MLKPGAPPDPIDAADPVDALQQQADEYSRKAKELEARAATCRDITARMCMVQAATGYATLAITVLSTRRRIAAFGR